MNEPEVKPKVVKVKKERSPEKIAADKERMKLIRSMKKNNKTV